MLNLRQVAFAVCGRRIKQARNGWIQGRSIVSQTSDAEGTSAPVQNIPDVDLEHDPVLSGNALSWCIRSLLNIH